MTDTPTTITSKNWSHVQPGDTIVRFFYGTELFLTVESVDENLIHTTGGWDFERLTGFEYDPGIGMGSEFGITCSWIIHHIPKGN